MELQYPYFIHGSADSTDVDVHVLIPRALPRIEAKTLCDGISREHNVNANLIVVEDGIVIWTYKGPVDEVNNALLATYRLHRQECLCPVERKVDRNVAVKCVRAVRGILGQFTRTPFREDVKVALRSDSWSLKLRTLSKLVNANVFAYMDMSDLVDRKKFIAFQIAQTDTLLDDIEIFTKAEVVEQTPEGDLRDYLYRKEGTPNDALVQAIKWFIYRMDVCLVQSCDIIIHEGGTKANIKTEQPL